ncbi:MAG: DUF3179 domain-containing protein [Chloroflexi bacterium]|nr:DUF3179 domain-containing protein [Chloroflexota bacterium]
MRYGIRSAGLLLLGIFLLAAAACSGPVTPVIPVVEPAVPPDSPVPPTATTSPVATTATTSPPDAAAASPDPSPTQVKPAHNWEANDPDGVMVAALNLMPVLSQLPNDPQYPAVSYQSDLDHMARLAGGSGNPAYIPILIDLLRVQFHRSGRLTLGSNLVRLIDQAEGPLADELADWGWWVEWLGNHPEVRPPVGYDGWKGRFLAFIDPKMGAFFYDGVKSRIRLEEAVWGGVPTDGIPDLTNAPVVSPADAEYLVPTDRVFGVSINGEHRAYPLRILNPHEMANDVLGGVPIALAN